MVATDCTHTQRTQLAGGIDTKTTDCIHTQGTHLAGCIHTKTTDCMHAQTTQIADFLLNQGRTAREIGIHLCANSA